MKTLFLVSFEKLSIITGNYWCCDRLFEASTGVDLLYGDELMVLERGLSFVGAIAGTASGGKSFVILASKFFKGLGNASTRLAKHAPLQYGKLSEFVHHAFKIVESAKSIRGKISNVGQAIPGTTVPKYFNLKTANELFHIHLNATKHMGEYIKSLPASHGLLLRNDLILASLMVQLKMQ